MKTLIHCVAGFASVFVVDCVGRLVVAGRGDNRR